MQKLTLAALLCCPLLGGCAAAALTAGAVILNDDYQDHSVSATVPSDSNFVWHSALNSLSGMTRSLIHRDDDLLQARTSLDYGTVQLQVKEVSVGQTQITVVAKKALVYSPELSSLTLERIVTDFDNLRKRATISANSPVRSTGGDWQDTVPSNINWGTLTTPAPDSHDERIPE
jgi:hypothetical protein